MLSNFRQYLEAAKEFAPITGMQETAIKLLWTLRKSKASLETYEAMMRWHLEANRDLRPNESLKRNPNFYSRERLYADLRKRYNRSEGYGNITEIVLPSSKAKARIVWNDAKMVIQSLLTNPRLRPDDYLFFENDPFAPPPDDLDFIGDLNTGRSYTETYNALITDPNKQILLPIPFYIDGAATGQFVDLPLTAVKLALGINTWQAREKAHTWGTIGYIPSPTKVKSLGRRQLIDSGHVDGTMAYHEMLENEGQTDDKPTHVAQDLHAMLDVIMASFVELQKKGLKWDLCYNGKIYKDVEFVLFVPFIQCDTDEADKLCGSYTSRGANVAQLCRYCKCPTDKSDDPFVKLIPKKKADIAKLVEKEDLDALRALSQQCIVNATYKLRFGAHSLQGVHGACPIEMLHGLLLGIFLYVRNTFFELVGETSQLAKDMDSLASEYGLLLHRQSDRNKPKTKFFGGIRRGRLMAKEYTGILLCLLLAIRSEKGQELLSKRAYFRQHGHLKNWVIYALGDPT